MLRVELADRVPEPAPQVGRAAEKVRGLPAWRPATTVFATPGDTLQQVRINCLADGKNLIMPGPGLKEGFFLVPARSVPFRDLGHAVTYKGLPKFGRPLSLANLAGLTIDLLVTDAVAVDRNGGRLGRGEGFFDLAAAILAEAGALAPQAGIIAIIAKEQLLEPPLPQDPWDVRVQAAVTPEDIHTFESTEQLDLRIFWDELTPERIRKITPLYKIREKGRG